MAELFDAQVTPETYVIDKQGDHPLSRRHRRLAERSPHQEAEPARRARCRCSPANPSTVAETKAFGCSVKRARTVSSQFAAGLAVKPFAAN